MLTAGIITGAISCLALLVYYVLTRNYNYWKKRGAFSPEPKFFFGNLKDYILRNTCFMESISSFYNDHPNEKVVGILRLTNPALVVRDLDILQHIFIKDFDTFAHRGFDFSTKGLGRNLFHADGESWRVLRTKLSPIFTSGKLKTMFPLIHDCGDNLLDYTDKLFSKQSELDIYPVIQKYTVASISSCAFGIDLDYESDNEFKKVLRVVDQLIFENKRLLEIDFLFPGILKKLNMDLFPQKVNTFFQNIVKSKIKERNEQPSIRKDFMDLLLDLKNAGEIRTNKNNVDRVLQIDDQTIAAQAFVFYAAGYETSASTMSYLLHELAYHQDIQDRCVQEINEVIEKNGGKITYDSLKEMTYLKQAFDETLRMYPIVDPIQRVNSTEYQIPGTDIVLEESTVILVPVRGIHYDENIYPEPHKFDPERFSPENSKARHPCAYLPFGVGSRNCIGMRFAQTQSMLCLAMILPKWRFSPASSSRHQLDYDPYRVILSSTNGIKLRMDPRK